MGQHCVSTHPDPKVVQYLPMADDIGLLYRDVLVGFRLIYITRSLVVIATGKGFSHASDNTS
jgi:hypothetical protein